MILLQQRTQPWAGGDSKQPEWRERFSTTRVDSATQAACSSSYTHVFRRKGCIFPCVPSRSVQTVCLFIFANILTHATAGIVLKSILTSFRSSRKHWDLFSPGKIHRNVLCEPLTYLDMCFWKSSFPFFYLA